MVMGQLAGTADITADSENTGNSKPRMCVPIECADVAANRLGAHSPSLSQQIAPAAPSQKASLHSQC